MSLLKRFAESFEPDDIAQNVTTFLASHIGCMAAPVLSTMTAGAVSSSAGLPAAIGFGALTTFGIEAWKQNNKVVDCARCAASDLQVPWRRYGTLALQVCLMGSMVHAYNTLTGHHQPETSHSFKMPNGDSGMVVKSAHCGNPASDKLSDTIWFRHTTGPRP